MVECKYACCVNNKDNKCTLENVKIDSNAICDSCRFSKNSNNPFEISRDEVIYMRRKTTIHL